MTAWEAVLFSATTTVSVTSRNVLESAEVIFTTWVSALIEQTLRHTKGGETLPVVRWRKSRYSGKDEHASKRGDPNPSITSLVVDPAGICYRGEN